MFHVRPRRLLLSALFAATLWPCLAQAQYVWIENPAGYMEITIPRVEEGARLLIQMRPIFEALDWLVEWAPGSRTITAVQGDDYRMTMQINNRLALVNGQQFILDVPPRQIRGYTYVPIRFVAEVTNCQVDYLGNAVRITDEDGTVLMVHLLD